VSISQEDLFSIALGLENPWFIKAIEFKVEEKQSLSIGLYRPIIVCKGRIIHIYLASKLTYDHDKGRLKGDYMTKFPESEYYLYKIFRKMPSPMLTWPILIVVINILSSYKIFLGEEYVNTAEFMQYYIGNTLFSILAFWLIVLIYKHNMTSINNWLNKNEILGGRSEAVNKLNLMHNYLFGKLQFLLIGAAIVIRRLILYFSGFEMLPNGIIIIDSIVAFLILSLIITSVGVIICLYVTGSNGIKVNYPFEIRNAYKDIASAVVTNTLMVGIFSAIYCSAVVFWAYQSERYMLGLIANIFFAISIILIFIVGIMGIQQGIAKSKQSILSKIKRELEKFQPSYVDLVDSMDDVSLSKHLTIISIVEGISNKYKEVEGTNEWMFDIGSVIKVALMSMMSFIISTFRIIFKI